MAAKTWTLVVTELGASAELASVSVEAPNWMAALSEGRTSIGESGGVPAGASCAVAPDGRVTIMDPVAHRSYVLTPQGGPAFKSARPPAGPRVPSPLSGATSAAVASVIAHGATLQGNAARSPSSPVLLATPKARPMAYGAAPIAGKSATEIANGGTMTLAGGTSAAAAMAPFAAHPAPEAESAAKAKSLLQEAPVSPATRDDSGLWELLSFRDEEPSNDSPILYRERIFVVPQGLPAPSAEVVLRGRFDALCAELESRPRGKFFQLAAFDHRFTDQPAHPPVATLEWKDWRGAPVVSFPASEQTSVPSEPGIAPAPAVARSTSEPPLQRHTSSAGDHDSRLAQAFEAAQDLLFLRSPVEGLDFTVRVLEELVPSHAITGALYDIDTDEFRFAVLRGPGADVRKGHALQSTIGLFGVVAKSATVLSIRDLAAEPRFDANAEGRPSLTAENAVYVPLVRGARLLGALQLLNHGAHGNGPVTPYSETDVEIANYLGRQLSEFLVQAKQSLAPPSR